jgi:hypothetical protein
VCGTIDVGTLTKGTFQHLDVTVEIAALGVAISALVGIASVGVPAFRAMGLTVAQGLRDVG